MVTIATELCPGYLISSKGVYPTPTGDPHASAFLKLYKELGIQEEVFNSFMVDHTIDVQNYQPYDSDVNHLIDYFAIQQGCITCRIYPDPVNMVQFRVHSLQRDAKRVVNFLIDQSSNLTGFSICIIEITKEDEQTRFNSIQEALKALSE